MNILILGYGSIGSRHGRILQESGHKVAFLRSGHGVMKPNNDLIDFNFFTDLNSAIEEWNPAYIVDCTPSALHHHNLLALKDFGIPMLLEKPLLTANNSIDTESRKSLAEISKTMNIGISFQYRFNELIEKGREFSHSLDSGDAISGYCIWSEYMPKWHPWEDYRKSYVSRSDLGGGCLLSMCHPFDYLEFIIGPIKHLKITNLSLGNLEIDVDDSIRCLVEFENNSVIMLFISMNSNYERHSLRLDTYHHSFQADLMNNRVNIYNNSVNKSIQFKEQSKDLLIKRLHSEFQESIRGIGHFRSSLRSHLKLAYTLAEAANQLHS